MPYKLNPLVDLYTDQIPETFSRLSSDSLPPSFLPCRRFERTARGLEEGKGEGGPGRGKTVTESKDGDSQLRRFPASYRKHGFCRRQNVELDVPEETRGRPSGLFTIFH